MTELATTRIPTDAEPYTTLDRVRRRYVATAWGIGIARSLVVLLATLGVSMLLDRYLAAPLFVRAMLLTSVSVWLILDWRRTGRPAGDVDVETVALWAERLGGDRQSRLISAVQLAHVAPEGVSSRLIDALVVDARRTVEAIDLRPIVPTRTLLSWAGGALILVIAIGIALAASGTSGWAWLGRSVLLPIDRPTLTTLRWMDDVPAIVPRGEAVTVAVHAAGYEPAAGTVRVVPVAGDAYDVPLQKTADGVYHATIDRLDASASLEARLYDAATPPVRIDVVDRPFPRRVRFIEHFPDYTHRPPAEHAPGDLRLLAGGTLEAIVEPSRSLIEATTLPPGNRVETLGVEGQRSLVQRDGVVRTESAIDLVSGLTGIRIHLVDANGITSRDETVYPITIVPDQPPTIAMPDAPTAPMATPVATLPIRARVTDDIGVAEVSLATIVHRAGRRAMTGGDGVTASWFGADSTLLTRTTLDQLSFSSSTGPLPAGVPDAPFKLSIDGLLLVRQDAVLSFNLAADEFAQLTLDGQAILTVSEPGRGVETRPIPIKAGLHTIHIDLQQTAGQAFVRSMWREERGPWKAFGPDDLYTDRAATQAARERLTQRTSLYAPPADEAVPTVAIDRPWRLLPLALQPGDEVEYWLEARDQNDRTGPGIARSEPRIVRIGTDQQVRQQILRELGDYLNDLGQLEQRQQDLADEVGKIVPDSEPKPDR